MPSRPNLLLVILDTARADHLPPHPLGERLAPRLSKEAEKGLALDGVRATAPWTLPSHASLFCGAWPSEHGIDGRAAVGDGARVTTLRAAIEAQRELWLPDALRRAGYRTWGVSANPWISEPMGFRFGFDEFHAVGPAKLRPREESGGTRRRAADRIPRPIRRPIGRVVRHIREWRGTGDTGGARAVAIVERLARTSSPPWFGFVNLMETHVPYAPPRGFNELRGLRRLRAPAISRRRHSYEHTLAYNLEQVDLDGEELDTIRALYRGEIRYLDHLMARMLDAFPRDRTAIVVTADHGEALGEHHQLGHQGVIEPVLRVPFLVLGPAPRPSAVSSLRQATELMAQAAELDPAPWRERGRVPDGVAISEYESTFAHDRRSVAVARRRGFPPEVVSRLETEMSVVTEGGRKLVRDGGVDRLMVVEGFDEREEADPVATERLRAHLRSARAVRASVPAEEEYSAQEQAEIEERLGQLGYL